MIKDVKTFKKNKGLAWFARTINSPRSVPLHPIIMLVAIDQVSDQSFDYIVIGRLFSRWQASMRLMTCP